MKDRTFIIAEAGVNHNGRLDLALELVRAAKNCGADAIKFQTFKSRALVTHDAPTALYQESNTGTKSQMHLLDGLELSYAQFVTIKELAKTCDIEFMSTAFDATSADFLFNLGIRRIKVPSGEITNQPFLRHLARQQLPMIVSTGMADLQEVREAVATIDAEHGQSADALASHDRLCLLHCTSIYPALPHQLNLAAITTLTREFGHPVGYSDHSAGCWAAPVAVSLGARVIEKHITLDRALPGPDHVASLEPHDFKTMVEAIRCVEAAIGDGIKRPAQEELETRFKVRRGIKLTRSVKAGEQVEAADLAALRPEAGIAPTAIGRIVGHRYKRDMSINAPLEWHDLDRPQES